MSGGLCCCPMGHHSALPLWIRGLGSLVMPMGPRGGGLALPYGATFGVALRGYLRTVLLLPLWQR